jgi:DNA topoisomerase-1
MAKPLVIVESPAKAKTISGFLGSDWNVLASVGHVRDLETKGLSVDVDDHFKPTYVETIRPDVKRDIKAALKDADEVYLATDEDREGEAISWHLLELFKPRVPVKRMVFHEITRPAIEHAVENAREIDYGLVDAQESRRIVDRLFGYPVSEVVWRKIRPRLSAGRVQSPAVRLVVERERERVAFVAADYWGIDAAFPTTPGFTARLHTLDGQRLAQGRDFDAGGRAEGVRVLGEADAQQLVAELDGATFSVTSVETKPYTQRPKAPFITSTLQQVGGSRLRLSAQQVMRVAQGLYERGYITYMRTDSTNLSETALTAARSQITELYGREYLPDAPRSYTKKAKNAQEAHEAIRPAGETFRTPDQLQGELSGTDLELYRLIWQRTVASQMHDARGQTVSVRIQAPRSEWAASGRTITFPGFLAVYGFAGDDAEGGDDDDTARLPELAEGQVLPSPALEAEGHTTQPPARYTEATLVKRLEELGIGRPSTYASIMQRIQNAGYVWKKGQALVPTTDAFALVDLLDRQFAELLAYEFTARMEDDLDEIAGGRMARDDFLAKFWFGNGTPGLKTMKELALEQADPAEVNVVLRLDDIELRNGKFGPYFKRGEETASLPEGTALDEVTLELAERLLAMPKGDEPIGEDPASGLPVYAKNGRFGPYVQLGDADTLPPKQKPKMASLFQTMSLERITLDEALQLLSLPRVIGSDPADGVEITAQNGRYGPYISKEKESRSLDNEERIFTVTLDEALALLATPKQFGRRAAKPPLRDLGADPDTGKPMVVKEGRFGIYVTDGETNATIPKSLLVETMTPEQASELLRERRERGPAPAKKAGTKKAAAKKSTAKKKAPAKKAAAKKSADS